MFKIEGPHQAAEGLSLTSLIDVLFILLIFFMIATNFKKNSLPLSLPESESTETAAADDTLVVSVSLTDIQVNGQVLPLDSLTQELQKFYAENPSVVVSLECERTLEFEKVVSVLTKIQAAGISRIGIVHEQPSPN